MHVFWIDPPRTAERLSRMPLNLDWQHRLIKSAAKTLVSADLGRAYFRSVGTNGSTLWWLDTGETTRTTLKIFKGNIEEVTENATDNTEEREQVNDNQE